MSSSLASALSSSNLASVHTPLASLPWFNDLLDQPTSLVVNPLLFFFSGKSLLSSCRFGLGVFGNVPCDLPRKVVRDALTINLGFRSSVSFLGVGGNNSEHSEHDWPIVSVGRSKVEDVETPLAVDFSIM